MAWQSRARSSFTRPGSTALNATGMDQVSRRIFHMSTLTRDVPAQTQLTMADTEQHIVFFHPDLGIGGAERLVIDAAVGLQNRGHKVTIFTSHCDPRHCFDEARDGKSPAAPATPPLI
jgi:hypothetical protein